MVDPHAVLALLDCPYCHTLVTNPVTLFCGHTICSSHLLNQNRHDNQFHTPQPSSSSSSSTAPLQPSHHTGSETETTDTEQAVVLAHARPDPRSRPFGPPGPSLISIQPPCPLATCAFSAHQPRLPTTTNPPPRLNLVNPPRNVRVAYAAQPPVPPSAPAQPPAQPQPQPPAPAPAPLPLPPPPTQPDSLSRNNDIRIRTDPRISNITALVSRAAAEAHRHPRPHLPISAEPINLHTHSDSESTCRTNPHPSPPLARPPLFPSPLSPPLPILDSPSRPSTPPPCPQPIQRRPRSPISVSGSDSPSPRKRRKTENRGTLSQSDQPATATTKLDRELLDLLTCEICFTLLFEPITTPCQHTFCTRCLQRTLDHSLKCPLCRQDFSNVGYFHNHPHNKMLSTMIFKLYPDALRERIEIINREERDPRLDTPIFVSQLSFPGLPTNLPIFEPRYRLMLRRCLQMSTPRFGMVISSQADGGFLNEFGTMLEIRSVLMLADGRSVVATHGAYRFRIIERGIMDGYTIARVERLDDIPPELEREFERTAVASVLTHSAPMQVIPSIHRSQHPPENVPPPSDDRSSTSASTLTTSASTSTLSPASTCVSTSVARYPIEPDTAALVQKCHDFLEKLRSNPMVVQRLNNIGPVPEDIGVFTFYVASVVPIGEHEKAKLLPIRSPRLRLRLVVRWIEQLEQHWWFQGAGCIVM